MLNRPQLRTTLFAVHGGVSLACGLAVLYLSLLAANPFFSAMAIVIALVLCGAAITLAGIADWFAAAETSRRNLQQVLLYALAGLCFVAAGSFFGFSSSATLQILLLLVIAHGLIFGALGLLSALRLQHKGMDAIVIALFGLLSIAVAGWMAGRIREWTDRSALVWVGAYLCLVGAKLFFFAGDERYHALHPRRAVSAALPSNK
jgi:predicted MFS family arabinose efflux permease